MLLYAVNQNLNLDLTCHTEKTYLKTCWGSLMTLLPEGNVYVKRCGFCSRLIRYVSPWTNLWFWKQLISLAMYTSFPQSTDTLFLGPAGRQTIDEIPLEAESIEKGYTLDADPTGLPKIHGHPSSFYAGNNDLTSQYSASPKNPRPRKSAHSGEQPPPLFSSSVANGLGFYPTIDVWWLITSCWFSLLPTNWYMWFHFLFWMPMRAVHFGFFFFPVCITLVLLSFFFSS